MRQLRASIILFVLFALCLDGYSAPRKRQVSPAKPASIWVKDNSKLFTPQQIKELNTTIQNMQDSVKSLPGIYVVTQNDYSVKSPFFKAFNSLSADDKWYISESKEYADDFVILVRSQSKRFATPQLNILCNRKSAAITPFITSSQIEQLQNEYNKYLSNAPNTAYIDILDKLIYTLRSRFFDGQIRDYSRIISPQDEIEIARLIQNFQESTKLKVAMVTTGDAKSEDSISFHMAEIVFVFYPKNVQIVSSFSKEKLSDKAIQNLTSDFALPQAKSGKYKEAMQVSLTALSAHLKDETPLDGMSIWAKLGAALLGVGIPATFGGLILKDSLKKKKAKAANTKPHVHKPVAERKPEKKEEKPHSHKPADHPTTNAPAKKLPHLRLTKPAETGQDRGWTLDNTGSLPVTMTRIDEVFKPISPRNEHEKVMLEMIDYMRTLREYTDHEISHSLGSKGVSIYLDELYGYIDPAAVRIVFTRGLDVLLRNYTERDPRVDKYITTIRH